MKRGGSRCGNIKIQNYKACHDQSHPGDNPERPAQFEKSNRASGVRKARYA